jgi:serine/threonine protein kinase
MAFSDAKDVSLVGQSIGNYKVVQQIGEGGMGVVYLAEHPVIGRKVAIKLLHATFARDSETVSRFFNEARAIHMIAHPNIVEILDFGQTTDGQPYFIMEFLDGQPLAARIEAGPVPPVEAVTIASQICDALQAAHDKNIVHRDLKPHNVYLVGSPAKPTVKILDFGVAKMTTGWNNAESGGHSVKTRTGSLMGTPLYMSPEQCRGSGKLDHRTDIYSLAVILYEMIAGVPPFTAEGVGELFAKHMLEPAPSLSIAAPHTPPHVVRAVARALAKDLEDRFATMVDFREALNGRLDMTVAPGAPRARSVSQVATSPGNRPVTVVGRQSEEATTRSSAVSQMGDVSLVPRRSHKGVLISVVVAVAVAGGAILLLRPEKPNLPPTPAVSKTPPHPAEPPAAAPAAPETVVIRFEAEPEATHVFRKVTGKAEGEDLGTVPVDLKLTKSDESSTYLFHADGFKDRIVNLDASRDRVQHLDLDRLPAPDKKSVKAPPHPPRPVRRPVVHDGDGLAVPSF